MESECWRHSWGPVASLRGVYTSRGRILVFYSKCGVCVRIEKVHVCVGVHVHVQWMGVLYRCMLRSSACGGGGGFMCFCMSRFRQGIFKKTLLSRDFSIHVLDVVAQIV